MILSSPFSRHHRSHQTWTGRHNNQPHQHQHQHQHQNHHHHNNHRPHGGSLKRAPPVQQPPKPPSSLVQQQNGSNRSPVAPDFRSHTLNRFELQQRRNQQLAHRSPSAVNSAGLNQKHNERQQIYAPASIASPNELAHYKRPVATGGAPQVEPSRHYAATSYRGPAQPQPQSQPVSFSRSAATCSESGRSGRPDSALGYLLERFGTLRRRARWSRLAGSTRRSSSTLPQHHDHHYNRPGRPGSPASLAQTDLDEIYATGGLAVTQNDTSKGIRNGKQNYLNSAKRRPEAEEIYAEGLRAIDGNGQKRLIEHQLNESIMNEGETRHLISDDSQRRPEFRLLVGQLTNWINDELAQQRIVITDLQEDLHDGQILVKLIEKLHQLKLDIVEVTQNEQTQKYKLRVVLDTINRILSLQARWAKIRWTVEGIHAKNLVEIVQLLVTLSLHYRAPIQLPADVHVRVLKVQKIQGQLVQEVYQAQLTCKHEAQLSAQLSVARGYQLAAPAAHLANGTSSPAPVAAAATTTFGVQRDAFDALCERNPEKLAIVKQSLVNFVNRHLNKINMSCLANRVHDVLDPEQFSDGLLLVFLMATLEDYFVPLGNLFTAAPSQASGQIGTGNGLSDMVGLKTALEPTSYTNTQPIHKLHNVNVAIQLMEEAGVLIRDRARAEDIVNGDLKTILRVLYALFSRYKHL